MVFDVLLVGQSVLELLGLLNQVLAEVLMVVVARRVDPGHLLGKVLPDVE